MTVPAERTESSPVGLHRGHDDAGNEPCDDEEHNRLPASTRPVVHAVRLRSGLARPAGRDDRSTSPQGPLADPISDW